MKKGKACLVYALVATLGMAPVSSSLVVFAEEVSSSSTTSISSTTDPSMSVSSTDPSSTSSPSTTAPSSVGEPSATVPTSTSEPSTQPSSSTSSSSSVGDPSTEPSSTSEPSSTTVGTSTTSSSSSTTTSNSSTTTSTTVTPSSTQAQEVEEGSTGSYPIYRLYNPNNGEHLYTTDANEKEVLYSQHGWGYEGIGWYAPGKGTAVYRLYNAVLQNHLYTTDTNEIKLLTSRYGWQADNKGKPVFYSGGTVNIYRVYNEALRGLHHWTTDSKEYNALPRHGWRQEGAAFSAVALGSPFATTQYQQVSATVGVERINKRLGNFTVRLSQVSPASFVQSIQVAIWSTVNGQNDLKWYTPVRQADGSYTVDVSSYQHLLETGIYQIHVYARLTTGMQQLIATHQVKVERDKTFSNVVFLDPGHGGKDSGAYYNGVKESTLNLSVANKVKSRLEVAGYKVIMTRTDDIFVDHKTQRSSIVNSTNADIFISIHFNASGAGYTTNSGIETYWYEASPEYPSRINAKMHSDPIRLARSQHLAQTVHASVLGTTGAADRKVLRDTFAVLRETAKPAILLELGYMDNPSDFAKMTSPAYQELLAQGIYQGITTYYQTAQ